MVDVVRECSKKTWDLLFTLVSKYTPSSGSKRSSHYKIISYELLNLRRAVDFL